MHAKVTLPIVLEEPESRSPSTVAKRRPMSGLVAAALMLIRVPTWLLALSIWAMVWIVQEHKHERQFLTPYSVQVDGYHRDDGTYVRPHSRRPPGSVAHDRPHKSKLEMLSCGGTLLIMFTIGCGCAVLITWDGLRKGR